MRAPMHGKVLAILVEQGAQVARGQRVAMIEAMKMEHALIAPIDGTVGEIAAAKARRSPKAPASSSSRRRTPVRHNGVYDSRNVPRLSLRPPAERAFKMLGAGDQHDRDIEEHEPKPEVGHDFVHFVDGRHPPERVRQDDQNERDQRERGQ